MIGLGTKLHHETEPGSGQFAELDACITNISLGGATVAVVEDGCMRADGGAIEKEPGQADHGQVTIDLSKEAGSDAFAILYAMFGPRDADHPQAGKRLWRIEEPDGEVMDFPGFLQAYGKEIPWNEKVTNTFTFEISGRPTLTTN